MSNFDNYKKERLSLIHENLYINKFIRDNNIARSTVEDNFSVFDDCLKSLEMCKNCKGLDSCPQRKKGEYLGLINDGFIANDIHYCKEYIDKENHDNYVSKFIYTDIPDSYKELTLDNITINEPSLQQLFVMLYDVFEGKRKKGLYINGDLGVGKTYACIALANSLINKGKKVAYLKLNEFANKMSLLRVDDSREYDYVINKIKKAEYLFIDDIGAETVTEFSRDRLLFNILDYRMENELITIFNSNFNKDALSNYYVTSGETMKAKRLMERIEVLSDEYCLEGKNKRRI